MKWWISVLVVLVLTLSMEKGRADIVAGWDVSGVKLDDGTHTTPYTMAASTTATHIAVADVSLSYSVNRSTAIDQYGFKISEGNEQTSLTGAITAGHYIEIVLTADMGYAVNLSSLELHGESSATGCDGVAVLSDVDGFSDSAVIASLNGVAGVRGGWDTDASGFGTPIDLAYPRFSELRAVTFRIYGWSSTGWSGVCDLRDLSGCDLVFNGTIEKLPRRGSVMVIK